MVIATLQRDLMTMDGMVLAIATDRMMTARTTGGSVTTGSASTMDVSAAAVTGQLEKILCALERWPIVATSVVKFKDLRIVVMPTKVTTWALMMLGVSELAATESVNLSKRTMQCAGR